MSAQPASNPLDFFITISVRSERAPGSAARPEDDERALWGAYPSPKAGVGAFATMGYQPRGERELMVCFELGQERLAESGLAGACFHARRLGLDLDAGRPFAVPVCVMRGALAPGRGFLLAEPFSHAPEDLAAGAPPRWAIPLWASEMELLANMGARAFLERAEREGVNFFDWRRDSLFGEKAPDTREEEAAELARRKAEREAEQERARAEALAQDQAAFSLIKAAPKGQCFAASAGLSKVCGAEVLLMGLHEKRQEALACAGLLAGFLKAETPMLQPGFIIGPYGELPGASGKAGFYIVELEDRVRAIYMPSAKRALRAIPVSAREIERAKRLGREAFEPLLLAAGDTALDFNRPCLFEAEPPEAGQDPEPEPSARAIALAKLEDERELARQEALQAQLRSELEQLQAERAASSSSQASAPAEAGPAGAIAIGQEH